MLKMWTRRKDDPARKLILLGLTHAHLEALLDGNAIQVDGRTLGLPDVDTVTIVTETDEYMLSQLARRMMTADVLEGAASTDYNGPTRG